MCGAITQLPNTPSWRGTQLREKERRAHTPLPSRSIVTIDKSVILRHKSCPCA